MADQKKKKEVDMLLNILVVWGAWKVVPISLERYGLVRFEVMRSLQV